MAESEKQKVSVQISDLVESLVGKINSFDSIKDKEIAVSEVLNDIIAKTELSKNQKAGVLVYLLNKRTQN